MPQALRQEFDDHTLHQQAEETVETRPKFQTYQAHEEQVAVQFEELAFFVQLFAFSILTVVFSFLLLANQVNALLAVPLAMLLSTGLVVGARSLIYKLF